MRKSVIAIIIIVLVVLYMSVFVVKEGERGITLRFGKVLRDDAWVHEAVCQFTVSGEQQQAASVNIETTYGNPACAT